MNRFIVAGMAFALSLGMSIAVYAAGDAEKGKVLFEVCAVCHGDNGEGNSALHAPVIGGQEDWYVERQLKNFKAGFRAGDPRDIYGAQMRAMAMTLADDQEIADVAAYVTSLKPPKPPASVQGDAALGQAAYALCVACHGANGEGNKALNSPKLTGQFDWYMVQQLKNYKEGIRGTNPQDIFGMQMRPMVLTLVDDDAINNMAAYINTLE